MACPGCDEKPNEDPPEIAAEDASTRPGGEGHDGPPAAEADCEGEGPCAGDSLCDVYDCGGRPARYNHFGCARVSCDADEDCPSGEACFSLAFDRSCEASSTLCFEEGDACVCEATEDCDGVLDAHCLPTEFYPPADYCDAEAFSCDELDAWQDALLRVAEAQSDTALSQALTDCATKATQAFETCQ